MIRTLPFTFGTADHLDDQFEVRIKSSSSSASAYLAGARLYATLTKAAPAEVYLRVSGHRRNATGAFFSGYYRHELDTARFSNAALRHEETGYCADGTPDGGVASRLADAFLNDSTSTYAQAPAGITYGSTVKKLVRIDPAFPGGWQSGDRVLMMHPATNSQYESAESFAVILVAP